MTKSSNNNNNYKCKEYIDSIDCTLANYEKIGSSIIIIGYLGFVYAANIDILTIKDIDTNGQMAEKIMFNAQKLITFGYVILLTVANERTKSKQFRNTYCDEQIFLSPYYKISNSYILSVIAHLIRLDGFYEVYQMALQEEDDGNDESSSEDED